MRKLHWPPPAISKPACQSPTSHRASVSGRRANILPLEVMLSIVEQLPDLESILFYDYGEPFLHKDAIRFLQTVRRQRPDIRLHTSTNGLALNPKKIEALAAEPLIDLIIFSIDGAWQESYSRYRVNGNFRSPGQYEALYAPASVLVRSSGADYLAIHIRDELALRSWLGPVATAAACPSNGCVTQPRGPQRYTAGSRRGTAVCGRGLRAGYMERARPYMH